MLSFFSNNVNNFTKQNMAQKLLKIEYDGECKKRFGFGKPRFPSIPEDNLGIWNTTLEMILGHF